MNLVCPGRFIDYNKCYHLVGMLTMGEAVHVGTEGAHGNSLYLPLNFAMDLKLL